MAEGRLGVRLSGRASLDTSSHYVALIRHHRRARTKRYGAEVASELFDELFLKRLDAADIRFSSLSDVYKACRMT